ncbi:MAG: aspartate aminotransferase family protein [bacterium (Candidatus Ratteibacteria) CG_4_10_14_3_um_filter_41_18]|uniref:Aspartate aminotransferase family protein n=4 Tax=Candidatus Ratteibacteria TaxID=2979319 RepID=A0A2M7YHX5_9BACT|nr:MAG: aspartate aminotransferase family protein [bacterium (Candidatus Ratteibacteria) CG01_land_8_20_14_3_00_40_19]PIW31413.1 MAG: aspartate aminotransferase family protein [bacterium (Candidatus Ratteibacteria) CG15_BIG_FIL_POST_REV_8_21_14_020_41_12]PIX77681.1 MAG: aspartate aminotransferase family protein [bacterium (Candidatus Ratteibacteria) CG_4_10_14_3_um_filter_41_18]PJA62566.1 MAG: aspartate aminotransferase family protein [bacterium (Candidatus Ratteibacteria) CG_4_9_14_3_um_filter_
MDKKKIEELVKVAKKYVWTSLSDYADIEKELKIFVKGEGCYLTDIHGKRYLDTFASLLTTICGHHRPEIARAVQEQMEKLEFFPSYHDCYTVPVIRLAEKLASLAPGDLSVSFFVNDGSEACESAIKMARQYFWQKGEPSRYKIIGRRYSYHGATLGALSATGLPDFAEPFQPLLSPGFSHAMSTWCYHCELGLEPSSCNLACLKNMEQVILGEKLETVAAVIVDPIPGSNIGYPVPPDGYLQGLRALCDNYGIFLIFDEIQVGFGKTGKFFCCENWKVVPDFLCLAKGFSGGYLPMGVVIAKSEIADEFRRAGKDFRHGFTFSGNPTVAAAVLANIEIIEKERLVEKAATIGKFLKERLKGLYKYPIVGDIRGMGTLWAIELVANKKSKVPLNPKLKVGTYIRDHCWKNGMILRNNGDILVIAPALIITKSEVDEMIRLMEQAIQDAIKHFNL